MHLPDFVNIELALTIFLHSNSKNVNSLNACVGTLFNENIQFVCQIFSNKANCNPQNFILKKHYFK